MIRRIFDVERLLPGPERTEGVHHHRVLVSALRAHRRLSSPWMRAVRDAIGMQRDGAELDPLPAHELTRCIVDDFIRVDLAVIVWGGNRLGMKVERTRAERADDEAIALKGLVHRRRLMHAAHDGLEVLDVERPRIELSVPADHVEWMVIERDLVDPVVLLDEN